MVDWPVVATRMRTPAGRLRIRHEARFVVDGLGRLLASNSPDRSAPPLFVAAGCVAGNLAAVAGRVNEALALALLRLAAAAPPLLAPEDAERLGEQCAGLFADEDLAAAAQIELSFDLPQAIAPPSAARLVASGTPAGETLIAKLRAEGMPPGLFEMGFVDVGEFWSPWCIALDGDEPASVAFAARLCAKGAEVGVATAPGLRGRGHAAAAVAGWARLPQLAGRSLFYSTRTSNRASRAVVARLGLRPFGATLQLA
jgi:hypothetical protein